MCTKYFLAGLSLMLAMNPANGASNSKVLCERIANHCRAACATYWDECHMEEDFTNELTPAIMPTPAKRTTTRRATTTTTRPFDETIYPVLRPEPFRPVRDFALLAQRVCLQVLITAPWHVITLSYHLSDRRLLQLLKTGHSCVLHIESPVAWVNSAARDIAVAIRTWRRELAIASDDGRFRHRTWLTVILLIAISNNSSPS